ncbi:hypothetical protein HY501_01255 [Candidatus Woesearchaeota archaeon]|nr:hypothetical protein [Candidatus Woesearchaeota archaeon]
MALTIKNGTLFLYFSYDVAYEIKLDRVETVFGEKPIASRLVCERILPEYVQYKVPPLLVRLGTKTLKVGELSLHAEIKAKLYDFGVVTIIYAVPISGGLSTLVSLTHELAENQEMAGHVEKQVREMLKEIRKTLVKPQNDLAYWENYLVINVQSFERPISGEKLLEQHALEIGGVLRCETERLSKSELQNAVKYPLSYYEDELVVVDWNAAFVYDRRQSYDIHDVLEYAVIQLLELRAYDDILDDALERAYDDLEKPARIGFKPYAKTLHDLTEVKLDVSEVMDKVTDSLKLIGDLYLAKVYKAAAQRFYLNELQMTINEKLKTVESFYSMLFDRANNKLLITLEVMIVLLFVVDLVMLYFFG